ncbi:DgyrCDS6057 [Dimorphilus gyrociliatus]|uniref:DgyrCDS6057 n=1 Tax=Dimorphilus gyrociliatus TaxID=2664684 RepID=A0A7I8VPP6_9ANNE|nr:DgyrCDS6057 [Dimorphilus gyrociliatus]
MEEIEGDPLDQRTVFESKYGGQSTYGKAAGHVISGHSRSASWPAARPSIVETESNKNRPASPVEGLKRLVIWQACAGLKWAVRKVCSRPIRQDSSRPSAYLVNTALSALPFLLFLTVYGNFVKLRHFLGITDDDVYVFTISRIEEAIFTVQPHRIVSSLHCSVLDVLAALPYLLHYAWPVLYPIYAFLTNRPENAGRFLQLLALVMWLHMVVWLCMPTAPPWFVDSLGNDVDLRSAVAAAKPSEGAAFARVDKLFHAHLFHNMYSGNPCIFGSFPSGHVAWPFAVYLTGPPGGNYFLIYIVWIIWASMYSIHHYLLDGLVAIIIVTFSWKVLQYLRPSANGQRDGQRANFHCPLHIV